MRVAVSADSKNGIDSVVSPHFGRCPYFILVDVEGTDIIEVTEVENPYFTQHQPGQVPGFIQSQGANVMLTGGMGGRAIMFFQQFDIEPVTGASGTIRRSLEAYLGGGLTGAHPCLESQSHGHGDIPPAGKYEKDEVGRLREETEMLNQQLDEVTRRLKDLDN